MAVEVATSTDPGLPTHIAKHYRVLGELARGGVGAVLRVEDQRTGQVCALKRLLPPLSDAKMGLFEREYRTLASTRHPGIIQVFDYGIDGGAPYYTMELLDGSDLRELAPLPFEEACGYLRDIASSLALLHTRRLLHRDIKPANIRLTSDGRCKLLDFGALTPFGRPERVVGTPPFMPPEALSEAPLDQRADVYSFGALCYWLLTCRHAYPARNLGRLPALWERQPRPPSAHVPGLQFGIDRMILNMLDPDPIVRPASMVEVVETLTRLGRLPPEDRATQRALGESYLATPPLVGRDAQLAALDACSERVAGGEGDAVLLEGPPGAGRSRLLAELELKTSLLGVPTVHVDAAMHDRTRGTAVAIVMQLLEKVPSSRTAAGPLRPVLAALDPGLEALLRADPTVTLSPVNERSPMQARDALVAVLKAAPRDGPVMLLVDNADQVDEASAVLLGSALRIAKDASLGVVCTARPDGSPTPAWASLAVGMRVRPLEPLTADDMEALSRAVFGDALHRTRFAQWLYERSGGLPLHFAELIRRLYAEGTIDFRDGGWILPSEAPDLLVPQGLEALIAEQLDSLSPQARALAEAMTIVRGRATRARGSRRGVPGDGNQDVLQELLERRVLTEAADGYAFRNNALRDAVDVRMGAARRQELHLQCAEEVLAEAGSSELGVDAQIEAARHLLSAGQDTRGADLLARVARDATGVRLSLADMQVVAPALEAALEVYEREGRSGYERAPLLTALAQAGYYEHHRWARRYGEQALDVVSELTGIRRAPRLQRRFGKTAGLVLALAGAWLRHRRQPRHTRGSSFRQLIVQLMSLATTLTGVAISALDGERAKRAARVLDPFMHLPERLTPVGLGQSCRSMCYLADDNMARGRKPWMDLQERFADERYYRLLPDEARPLVIGGMRYCRGVTEGFRGGDGAMRAANALDRLGMRMYQLVASQLRVVHYACRGDLEAAKQHAERVEAHAIELGSASQVEHWSPAVLLPPYIAMNEAGEVRLLAQRLRALSSDTPSLTRYADMADLAVDYLSMSRVGTQAMSMIQELYDRGMARFEELVLDVEPRAYVGWGVTISIAARVMNEAGDHARAKAACQRMLSVIEDIDREYPLLYLGAELEDAVADGVLGDPDAARTRLDELLARHHGIDNPLVLGMIHDAHCRLAAAAERWDDHHEHLTRLRELYRPTHSSGLAGRLEVLASLAHAGEHPADAKTGPADSRSGLHSIPASAGRRRDDLDRDDFDDETVLTDATTNAAPHDDDFDDETVLTDATTNAAAHDDSVGR